MSNPNQSMPAEKLTKEGWYQLLKEWEVSNLSQQAFCQQKQVGYNTFTYWRGKILKKKRPAAQPLFSKVSTNINNTKATTESIYIIANGKKILVPLSASDQQLQRLFRLLGICNVN